MGALATMTTSPAGKEQPLTVLAPGARLGHPLLLKLELLRQGVRCLDPPPPAGGLLGARPELLLPGEVRVTPPLEPTSPYLLALEGERAVIELHGRQVVVGCRPPRALPSPRAALSGTTLLLLPEGQPSPGLTLASLEGEPPPLAPDPLRRLVSQVRADHYLEALLLVAPGEPCAADSLLPHLVALKRHHELLVILAAPAPAGPTWVEQAYGAGADALILTDPPGASAPPPWLRRVARLLPRGALLRPLAVGGSGKEGWERCRRELAQGALPLPRARPGASLPALVAELDLLGRGIQGAHLATGFLPGLGLLFTPRELELLAGARPGWLRRLGRGDFGRAQARVSDLLRALKVRQVEESYGASGL